MARFAESLHRARLSSGKGNRVVRIASGKNAIASGKKQKSGKGTIRLHSPLPSRAEHVGETDRKEDSPFFSVFLFGLTGAKRIVWAEVYYSFSGMLKSAASFISFRPCQNDFKRRYFPGSI